MLTISLLVSLVECQQQPDQFSEMQTPNFPFYIQSPIDQNQQQQGLSKAEQSPAQISQRQTIPAPPPTTQRPRTSGDQKPADCIYDKQYFANFDECLARKPYPTIGLPAFKNEDLLVKRGLSDRHGCVFVLNNGLFKNYQLANYAINSDSKCLDGGRLQLSMAFSNVSLYYLWTLRCLNYADQLLEDATLNGRTSDYLAAQDNREASATGASGSLCAGSSQSFGFAALQLSNIEAQLELATDIYKNWRVTNVTVALLSSNLAMARQLAGVGPLPAMDNSSFEGPFSSSGIKEFVFDSLDGDELNWRYLHLFQNWSRNRMHTNFLEQFRRFVWISLQRCLSESSEKLPTKLVDLFAGQRIH